MLRHKNAQAADGSRKGSYADAAVSSFHSIRSTRANGGHPAKSGNGAVAGNVQEPAVKDAEVVTPSPDALAAAPASRGLSVGLRR